MDHLTVLFDEHESEIDGASPRCTPAALRDHLRRCGWRDQPGASEIEVWTRGAWPPAVEGVGGGGVLVGERFGSRRGEHTATSPEAAARELIATSWGAWVAVWPARSGGPAAVCRDPSGGREALVWRAHGRLFTASSLAAPGVAELLPRLSVARDTVARWLVDPQEIGAALALEEVEAVTPGALWREGEGETPLWWPARVVGAVGLAGEAAERALRVAVDSVAAAWAGLDRPLLGEISGGLDSAVAASALAPTGRVGRWLNFFAPTPEGDERRYARAVASKLGVELTELPKAAGPWNAAAMGEVCVTPRPALNASDVDYDRTVARQVVETGAWGVVTGQGGDAVFLNLRSAALATGRFARRGWRAVADPQVRALAARLRTSVWHVRARARRAAVVDPWPSWSPRLGVRSDLEDLRPSGPKHPWLQDLGDLDPAKRLQVVGLTQALLGAGECRRSRAARLLHLPLQQPVIELCLGLPVEVLSSGERDRALARNAFASRLPPEVIARRSKGDLTALYGRGLARALPFIRERLLDGDLRRLDLLDVETLETRLTADALMREGGFGDVVDLLAIENWLQDWGGRSTPASAPAMNTAADR